MAPMQEKQRRVDGAKASSLSSEAYRSDRAGGIMGRQNARSGRKNDRNDALNGRKTTTTWQKLIVDLILLVVIAALVVGCALGYRALKNVYAPAWEERTVEFCIRIQGVDVAGIYDNEGHSLFENCDVWHTERVDGERMGKVVGIEAPPEENGQTATLYLTVRGTANYREKEGYYIGETRLLAGMESTFRVRNIMAKGVVISLEESN